MAIKFSLEQQAAIYSQGQNIIVSAGAGSGKTAVLTERIKRILLSGVKANELLVLTFTNAAAREMKERITKTMAKDELLVHRTAEVDSAYITTFDSFSLSLVKKYHHRLNLTNKISIMDNAILNVKKREIIDDIFFDFYEMQDPNFERLICDLTPKDDSLLRKEILNISNKIDQLSDRNIWLNQYLETYFSDNKINEYLDELTQILLEKMNYIKDNLSKLQVELTKEQYLKMNSALCLLLNSKNYDEIRNNMKVKLPILKNLSENATLYKKEIKTCIDDIQSLCIFTNSTYIKEAYFQSEIYVEVIIRILKKYYQKIDQYKFKHEVFEFIDISKMAIQLVKENEDIKEELKNHFKEILIDEYQDTNNLQEEFISYISNHNVYMVGDIKQSIYGFRNANPFIFKEKYDAYKNHNGGIKIDLNQNFRSNRPVLFIINRIFDHIMDNQIGQANFKEEHEMHFGLKAYETGNQENKIKYVTYSYEKGKYKSSDIEMFYILKDIQEKINHQERIFDKDLGDFRPCEYRDFAILLSDSSLFSSMSKLLSYYHIPNLVFKNIEVNSGMVVTLIKNIIKMIDLDAKEKYDNEFLRLFYGVGRSFLIGLSDEELFDYIRLNSFKESSLYRKIHFFASNIKRVSLSELVEKIVDEFDLYHRLLLIGDIESNLTRIEFLKNILTSMEKLELTIDDFVTYIDGIYENEDVMEFPSTGIDENKVKIMTIHKSKGLEFPIVYFMNNNKLFNKSEIKDKISFDLKYGILTPYFIQGEGENISHLLMKENNNLSLISEKIRLLYVALTRAREQIIIFNNLLKEDTLSIMDDIVPSIIRKKYNSFKMIYDSVNFELNNYRLTLEPKDLNINEDYLKPFNEDVKQWINPTNKRILHVENIIEIEKEEKKHASKETYTLRNKEEMEIMEYGTYIHELFESVDFLHPKYELYSDKEKDMIEHFLNLPLLKNRKKGKIFKEFEFIDEQENQQIHGIIDLMIVYENHIDIIDYKLSHLDDDAYEWQLKTYQKYIEKKFKKIVHIWLYSILKQELKQMDENSVEKEKIYK